MSREYESAMHVIADALVKQFEGSDAVNYIEQTFTDKTDESKSFVLTMQRVKGLTPCQKLQNANDEIENKKQQRIKYLVGIYNAMNSPLKGASDESSQTTYSKTTTLQILKTVEFLLKEDGITPDIDS